MTGLAPVRARIRHSRPRIQELRIPELRWHTRCWTCLAKKSARCPCGLPPEVARAASRQKRRIRMRYFSIGFALGLLLTASPLWAAGSEQHSGVVVAADPGKGSI